MADLASARARLPLSLRPLHDDPCVLLCADYDYNGLRSGADSLSGTARALDALARQQANCVRLHVSTNLTDEFPCAARARPVPTDPRPMEQPAVKRAAEESLLSRTCGVARVADAPRISQSATRSSMGSSTRSARPRTNARAYRPCARR